MLFPFTLEASTTSEKVALEYLENSIYLNAFILFAISIESIKDTAPLPDLVVNPNNQQLCPPKQINSYLLAMRILELSSNPDRLKRYSDTLNKKVINQVTEN